VAGADLFFCRVRWARSTCDAVSNDLSQAVKQSGGQAVGRAAYLLAPVTHCMKVNQVGAGSNGMMTITSLPTCARVGKRAKRGCQERPRRSSSAQASPLA